MCVNRGREETQYEAKTNYVLMPCYLSNAMKFKNWYVLIMVQSHGVGHRLRGSCVVLVSVYRSDIGRYVNQDK